MFEKDLFYDPFLEFFHGDTQNKILPEFDTLKLFLGLLLRYFMNGILTIIIFVGIGGTLLGVIAIAPCLLVSDGCFLQVSYVTF